jgi:Holliday junction resolvase RusA-like endonuclease
VASLAVDKCDSQGLRSVSFTVYGEPASKANSRQLVTIKGRPAFIKSAKARRYVIDFKKQCPKLNQMLEGDLSIEIHIWYASRRPDLDASLIFDAMEGMIYPNDRRLKQMHLFWHLDRENARAEIIVKQIRLDDE